MRKDMYRRSKDVETNDAADENGDPLSGSSDPFDALVSGKTDDAPASRSNGKRQPSPIPDDSDAENDTETKNDDDKSETNGGSAVDSAENGDATAGGDDEGYEVEDIVDHKIKGKKKYFKIRWKNYDESQDTWEPEDDLSCPEIIERYLEKHPEAAVAVKKTPKKEKKVRISLPPSRAAPKRTAAERKSIVDEPLSDDDDNDSTGEKKKSSPGKRGRPKKGNSPKGKSGKGGKTNKEYEVQKIVDDEMRNGKKYYRIRWKGWSAKDDTWEPKASLSCPDIIKAYENSKEDDQEYEVEKIVGEKIEYGVRYFLVKWKGWPESSNNWESEKSVDCHDLIEKFRDSCRSGSAKSNKRAANSKPKASKAKKAKKAKKHSDTEDDDDDEEEENSNGDVSGEDCGTGTEEKEWEVEKVVNQRKAKGGKKEYLIRWKGCKASDDTWEPEDGINCPELIAAFLKKNKK